MAVKEKGRSSSPVKKKEEKRRKGNRIADDIRRSQRRKSGNPREPVKQVHLFAETHSFLVLNPNKGKGGRKINGKRGEEGGSRFNTNFYIIFLKALDKIKGELGGGKKKKKKKGGCVPYIYF